MTEKANKVNAIGGRHLFTRDLLELHEIYVIFIGNLIPLWLRDFGRSRRIEWSEWALKFTSQENAIANSRREGFTEYPGKPRRYFSVLLRALCEHYRSVTRVYNGASFCLSAELLSGVRWKIDHRGNKGCHLRRDCTSKKDLPFA